jgi:hypothetical protein
MDNCELPKLHEEKRIGGRSAVGDRWHWIHDSVMGKSDSRLRRAAVEIGESFMASLESDYA